MDQRQGAQGAETAEKCIETTLGRAGARLQIERNTCTQNRNELPSIQSIQESDKYTDDSLYDDEVSLKCTERRHRH